jgi:hypothetical protein
VRERRDGVGPLVGEPVFGMARSYQQYQTGLRRYAYGGPDQSDNAGGAEVTASVTRCMIGAMGPGRLVRVLMTRRRVPGRSLAGERHR